MIDFPEFQNIRKISARERIQFSCTGCANCCKNVRDSILLNPLDVFRLVKHFREQGSVQPPEEILEELADLKELSRGVDINVLWTINDGGVCRLLKSGRCTVYASRPSTCRLYPFSPDFKADGTAQWHLCLEQPHHFEGGCVTTREWKRQHLKKEDVRFFQEEAKRLPLIGKLLHDVPDTRLQEAEISMLTFYYYTYSYDEPFLPQYKDNMAFLAARLKDLQNE